VDYLNIKKILITYILFSFLVKTVYLHGLGNILKIKILFAEVM
jgi:hypothetical protein